MSNKLAIITVVYRNYNILKDFFESFKKQKKKNFKLFISDLSENKKPIKTDFPTSIINSKNLGYAHGVNLGLKKAMEEGFDKFCVVNNDIYFNSDFTEKVFSTLKNNPTSIIGGKIYYAPGYEYHKEKYKKTHLGRVIWYAGGRVDWRHALTPHEGVDQVDTGKYNHFKKTDFVNGALMCFDRKVIERVGFWDEKYFLYFEDADFCERAKRKGVQLYYDPSIVIWHKNAQSTGGAGSSIHQKYQRKNRLIFALKYAPLKTKIHLIKNYLLGK